MGTGSRPFGLGCCRKGFRGLALACTLTVIAPSAAADSVVFGADTPWKEVVGDYVFVMLLSRCESELNEAVMSRRELEMLQELRVRKYWSNDNVQPLEPCIRRARRAPVITEELGDAVLVRMHTQRVTYQQSIRSATGEYYPASGLYRNDGSVEPLWTVDWFGGAIVSTDGVHLVRTGPKWESSYHHVLAVGFYRSGQLLKAYSVADLVADPQDLPHSVSHFSWEREIALDEEAGQLYVATLSGEEYYFNLSDGEIASRKAPPANEQAIRVLYANGDRQELAAAHTCAGTGHLVASMTQGKAAERNFYAYRLPTGGRGSEDTGKKQEGPTLLELLTLPLERIRDMHRTKHSVQRDANTQGWDEQAWLIRLQNGQSFLAAIDVAELRLCGETSDGREMVVTLEGVAALEFL